MIDEQTQDLVLQYLLGELDAPQMENVRAQIESDPELRTFANEMEEMNDLLRREARGRLVKDHDARSIVHRASDLHHLALRRAQKPDGRRRIDMEVERL